MPLAQVLLAYQLGPGTPLSPRGLRTSGSIHSPSTIQGKSQSRGKTKWGAREVSRTRLAEAHHRLLLLQAPLKHGQALQFPGRTYSQQHLSHSVSLGASISTKSTAPLQFRPWSDVPWGNDFSFLTSLWRGRHQFPEASLLWRLQFCVKVVHGTHHTSEMDS